MSELLYNVGKKSKKTFTITTLIVIPPESKGSSPLCAKTCYNYSILPLLKHNYCHCCFCKLSWKTENEVHAIRQVASVHWSGKETHYTDQLPIPPSAAGELVPFWAILFHSSSAIDSSMQREPQARDSDITAQLNCRFPSEYIWFFLVQWQHYY